MTSLWDGRAVSSQWFAQHVTHQPAPCWDYYLLFSSRARWAAVPGPVVSQGGPVISQTGALLGAIQPLLPPQGDQRAQAVLDGAGALLAR